MLKIPEHIDYCYKAPSLESCSQPSDDRTACVLRGSPTEQDGEQQHPSSSPSPPAERPAAPLCTPVPRRLPALNHPPCQRPLHLLRVHLQPPGPGRPCLPASGTPSPAVPFLGCCLHCMCPFPLGCVEETSSPCKNEQELTQNTTISTICYF